MQARRMHTEGTQRRSVQSGGMQEQARSATQQRGHSEGAQEQSTSVSTAGAQPTGIKGSPTSVSSRHRHLVPTQGAEPR